MAGRMGKLRLGESSGWRSRCDMKKKVGAGLALAAVMLAAIAFWGYQHWRGSNNDRDELLSLMPVSANAVVYVDLQALRNSPFLAGLYAWAPRPSVDADYAEFV